MKELKDFIHDTIMEEVKVDNDTHYLEYPSVQDCSDTILKEIKDIAIEFATHVDMNSDNYDNTYEEDFDQFIKERYAKK